MDADVEEKLQCDFNTTHPDVVALPNVESMVETTEVLEEEEGVDWLRDFPQFEPADLEFSAWEADAWDNEFVLIGLGSTVSEFKAAIAQNCDVPPELQRLIYKGRILKDDQTLASYGLQADHTVHMVRGSPPTATNTGTVNSGGANTTPGIARNANSTEGGALGGAGLGASFQGFWPWGWNGLNPQMREIIDRNPELAHILNDPSTLRQTLEAARNPELMREMMRNTDRAMSNIESSPEGFNMLRRMYETVQEPFLNATTMSGDAGTGLNSNPFAALLGNQGGAPAGDRSSPPNAGSETTGSPAVPNTNPLPNPWSNNTVSVSAPGAAANSPTRPNPAGDARTPSVAGLGGLGLPEMDRMLGGMQDPSMFNQLMQNPAMSQMMQSVLSNPQYMNQACMIGLNPQLRSMLDSNPQLREMMQNPEFLRQLTSPEIMQQAMALQQSLLPSLGRQQPTQESGQTGTGTGAPNNAGLEMLMNMFSGLGAGSLTVPSTPNVPPEQLYATQLTQLQEMGFIDTQENIRALTATAGNVHAAVERLLGNPGL
ncbi:hypothetical protein Sjap_017480 [Stephania japonica]|uniref:Ubiquilin n=1 Tax=Stephania japonica TaxID=461633 RepID=A0AAP0NKF1_9MAGN